MAEAPAWLLDVSRLVSRAGQGPWTGIDRVELAYLRAIMARGEPVFGLARAAPGQALLGREGLEELAARIEEIAPWGAPDWLSRLHLRQPPARRRVVSDLRRLALGWRPLPLLGELLRRYLPEGARYLNTGHTNMSDGLFAQLRHVPGVRAGVLVHDMIPLDHPEWARPRPAAAFAARMQAVGRGADMVIYNSHATRAAAERHFAAWGRVPPGVVAHLGVDVPRPDTGLLERHRPAGLEPGRPYLVAVGTIEPRKNHGFLLDLWEAMAGGSGGGIGDRPPALCIAGGRGWCSDAFFRRLDRITARKADVFELPGLGDGALGALMACSHGLVFPSLAEGFGLPAGEAASLGVPVVCNDLPVFREILKDYPVYVRVSDPYLWRRTLIDLARQDTQVSRVHPPELPGWDAHFYRVFTGMC